MRVLHLPLPVRSMLADMARAGLPNEICGLLSGPSAIDWAADDPVLVSAVWPVANSLASPVAFSLDGAEMLEAEDRIERRGDVVIGVAHSHPTAEPRPSKRDIADAAVYDPMATFVHVIVSMQGFAPVVRAWRMPPDVALDPLELSVAGGDLRFE